MAAEKQERKERLSSAVGPEFTFSPKINPKSVALKEKSSGSGSPGEALYKKVSASDCGACQRAL
jgi:hypothetical protein